MLDVVNVEYGFVIGNVEEMDIWLGYVVGYLSVFGVEDLCVNVLEFE